MQNATCDHILSTSPPVSNGLEPQPLRAPQEVRADTKGIKDNELLGFIIGGKTRID